MHAKRLVFSCLCILGSFLDARAREWTDVDGHKINAEYVRMEGDKVVLLMRDREYPVPLARLSEADQSYIREVNKPPSDADKVVIGGATARAGDKQLATFTLPLPEGIARKTAGDDRPHKELKIGVMLPKNFDSSKPQKFLFVWTPVNGKADQERGSIPTVRAFAGEAVPLGWTVFAIDTDIGYPDGDHYPGIVLEGLSALEAAIPSFKDSIFACGGFSGGAKNCTTASGALIEKGYKLRGIFMGGCNQDLLEQAQKSFQANKSDYREVKGFLSNGKEDRTASVAAAEGVAASLDSNGMKNLRRETFEGGHQLYKPHVGEALRWFEAE